MARLAAKLQPAVDSPTNQTEKKRAVFSMATKGEPPTPIENKIVDSADLSSDSDEDDSVLRGEYLSIELEDLVEPTYKEAFQARRSQSHVDRLKRIQEASSLSETRRQDLDRKKEDLRRQMHARLPALTEGDIDRRAKAGELRTHLRARISYVAEVAQDCVDQLQAGRSGKGDWAPVISKLKTAGRSQALRDAERMLALIVSCSKAAETELEGPIQDELRLAPHIKHPEVLEALNDMDWLPTAWLQLGSHQTARNAAALHALITESSSMMDMLSRDIIESSKIVLEDDLPEELAHNPLETLLWLFRKVTRQ